jgi:hypothetical protein
MVGCPAWDGCNTGKETQVSRVVLLLAASIGLAGCASIVSGTSQPLSVEARSPDGAAVAAASCTLTNDKGKWFVSTPGSVTVHRSFEDLVVACTKEKFAGEPTPVKSSTKGMTAGNILFGGLIGVGIDMSTGSAYDYPNLITVMMTPAPATVP